MSSSQSHLPSPVIISFNPVYSSVCFCDFEAEIGAQNVQVQNCNMFNDHMFEREDDCELIFVLVG